MPSLLSVNDVSVTFTKPRGLFGHAVSHPVAGCSLELTSGEFVAVVGQSGAGKSLLAHAIMGLLPPDATMSGSITYHGAPLDSSYTKSLRGNKLRFIPQSVNNLDPTMTIGEFLRRAGHTSYPSQDVHDVLESYGIRDLYHRYPHELSGGQRRHVLLASISFGASDAELVITDEPTPGIDNESLRKVKETFTALHDNGAAILMITHDVPLAMEMADRIAVFKDGRIIDTFTPAMLLNSPSSCHEYSRALWAAQPVNWQVKA